MKSFSQFFGYAKSVTTEPEVVDERTVREKYIDGDILLVGEPILDSKSGNVGDIIRRGANYLICLGESEKVFRCWVEDAQVVS